MSDGLSIPRVRPWLWRKWHWGVMFALLVGWGVVHEQAASLFAQRPGGWVVVDDRDIAREVAGLPWRRPLTAAPNAIRATEAAGLLLHPHDGGWSVLVDNMTDPQRERALMCDERPRNGLLGMRLAVRQSHDLRALQFQCRTGMARDAALLEPVPHLSLRYVRLGERTERPVFGPWYLAVVASRKAMNRSVMMVSLLLLVAACSAVFGRALPRQSAPLPQSPYRASKPETEAEEFEAPHGPGALFWISALILVFTALETRRAMRAPEALRHREGDVPQMVRAKTATVAVRLS